MRLIVEAFGRAWLWSFHSSRTDESCEVSSQSEFEHAPVDPHSVGGGNFERRSDYEDALAGQRRFGFHGREE